MFNQFMSGEGPRRGRGRPRTPGAEDKILAAALAEYGEHGWSGFTMDGVARRAAVGKSTVYLRWPDKDSLLTDAVTDRGLQLASVDTGTLEGDLAQLALNLLLHFNRPAGWAGLRVTFDTASAAERLGDFAEAVNEVHTRQVEQICRRAIQRGEMKADLPLSAVGEAIYGAAIVHTLSARLDRRVVSEDDLETRARDIVALVLCGVASNVR